MEKSAADTTTALDAGALSAGHQIASCNSGGEEGSRGDREPIRPLGKVKERATEEMAYGIPGARRSSPAAVQASDAVGRLVQSVDACVLDCQGSSNFSKRRCKQ